MGTLSQSLSFARAGRLVVVAFAIAGFIVPLKAVENAGLDSTQLAKLLERLDRQDAEIAALKSRLGETESASTASEETFPKINFHGFGDITYRTNHESGAKDSFVVGQLDFFVTSALSEKVGVLVETVFEADEHNQFGGEVERILLQVHHNSAFNVDFGRYHSSIGYYNTAYHHGTWFQTAVGRPDFLDFEDGGGLIPTHNVGLSMTGAIPSGHAGLHYIFEVGNGRPYFDPATSPNNPVLNISDTNNDKSYNLALYVKPDGLPGLQAGAGFYLDHLSPEGLPPTVESILHGYLSYRARGFEGLVEGYRIEHAASHGATTRSHAALFQISKKLGDFTPYLRYQYKSVPLDDAVFAMTGAAGTSHGPTLGLRYDFCDYAAFKLQYQHLTRDEQAALDEAVFQACFTF